VRGLGKLLQKEGKKMYNNYPNYYPQVQQSRPQMAGLRGRPVSSLDEVRATSVDFDGSISFFPDLANKRIYTKQINLDGTAAISMYELKNLPIEPTAIGLNNNYVTKEEFDETLKKIQSMFDSLTSHQNPAPAPPPVEQEFKF